MQSIYSEFREKVVAMPDAMAVQDGSRMLTYAQLDAAAFACAGCGNCGRCKEVELVDLNFIWVPELLSEE